MPVSAFSEGYGRGRRDRHAPADGRVLSQTGAICAGAHAVDVVLASDVNPGGGFSPSMAFVITLACFGMAMTLEEALVGATINGGAALDADRVGSLEVGKQMDAVMIDGTLADLTRVGIPVIRNVIKRGAVVA